MDKMMVSIIRFYSKYVSPVFSRRCRYYPTCSSYAIDAFERKGFYKGLIFSVWRVLRCNPFSPGGYDPVEVDDGR